MKRIGHLMASAAAVLLASGGAASAANGEASATAEAAWAETVKCNSLEAYAEFAMTHPESKFARVAYSKLSGAGTVGADANATAAWTAIDVVDENGASMPGFVPNLMMVV